ncbi:MAG: hypothetical protein ACE5MH_09310 [Terriglobia bacterium]
MTRNRRKLLPLLLALAVPLCGTAEQDKWTRAGQGGLTSDESQAQGDRKKAN